MKYKHIIWDWNGTLFNDVDACIAAINPMLKKRNLKLIKSVDYYREIFDFPVINYYKKLGFDFDQESFLDVAEEYVMLYHQVCSKSKLVKGAIDVINQLDDLKINQIIVSASEQSSLLRQMEPFNIKGLFKDVVGIDDNLAYSKLDLAKKYVNLKQINNNELLLVGDSHHDYEVARSLGCDCVLVSWGHINKERLKQNDTIIIDEINELLNLIR